MSSFEPVSQDLPGAKQHAAERSKSLHVLDDRPAVVLAEIGAVFVPAVAVAIGVIGIGDERAVGKRRLLGVVADILGIEDAAADLEAGLALLGGLQQFPEIRHRTIVKIGSGRP